MNLSFYFCARYVTILVVSLCCSLCYIIYEIYSRLIAQLHISQYDKFTRHIVLILYTEYWAILYEIRLVPRWLTSPWLGANYRYLV